MRREIIRWHERVNIRGERIALPLDGPLGEAAWMKRAQEQRSLRLIEVLERDERSLTQIVQGLDAIDADQHERDAPTPLGLELPKRPEPRGETDGWERHPAGRYRIADTLLADLEAASHRVAEIDSHIKEQSRAGEIGRARREQRKDGNPDVQAAKAAQ